MLAELKGVKRSYGAFQLDVTMQLEEGRITGVVGKNGAGKSTTFKAMLGLIHTEGGTMRLLGQDGPIDSPKRKQQVGVVLSGSTFCGALTGKQVCGIMESLYDAFDRNWFQEQCRRLAIPLDRKITEFSTGMRAKLKVLLALSYKARLLILDEPTAGLDVVARETILDLLRSYMEQEGRGILISSHISSDLEGLCDDLYLIDDGKIALHEEMDVLLDQYGLLKMDEATWQSIDKSWILRWKKEPWGVSALTSERRFYQENYPKMVAEKGSVDEMVYMAVKGEKV